MAKNFIEAGDSIMIAIPAGGCSSGGQDVANEPSSMATPGNCIVLGGDLVGIPANTFSAGTAGNVTLHLEGAFGNMAKHDPTEAWNQGDKLYAVVADGSLTATSSSNVFAGWAWDATINGATVCSLRLKQG